VSPARAREPAAVPTGHLVPWVRSYKRAACDICPPLSPLPFTSGKPSAAGPLFRPPPFFLGRPPHHSYFTVRRSKGGITLRGSSRTCRNHLYLVGAPPHRSRAAAGALSSVSQYQSGPAPFSSSLNAPHTSLVMQVRSEDVTDRCTTQARRTAAVHR
jgi:hypothetical protein